MYFPGCWNLIRGDRCGQGGPQMSDREILLQGGNWKKKILTFFVLIAIGLIILYLVFPKTISSTLAEVYDYLAGICRAIGDYVKDLQ